MRTEGNIRRRTAPRCAAAGALFAIIGLLAGCASFNPLAGEPPVAAVAAAPPPAVAPPPDELLAFVVAAAPGQSRIVADPRRGAVRVRVDREYFSAEGVVCRRFTLAPAAAAPVNAIETRAACREAGGWRLTAIGSAGAIPEVP